MTKRKNNKKMLAMGTAMVALSALSAKQAYAAGSANVLAKARILNSGQIIVSNQSLNFGTFSTGGAGGTVAVDTAGTPTYTGVNKIATSVAKQAKVMLIGKAATNVDLMVTKSTISLTNGAAATMKVNNFHVNTNAAGRTNNAIALGGPTVFVPIGATLTVPGGKAAGTYTGTFTVDAVFH